MNSKPFIHLYRSPRGYYLYDVNKDTIIAVSSAVYNYLDDKKSFEELSSEDQCYINELKVSGYLSSKRYSEIRHPGLDRMEYELNRRCSQLILQVTQACNLVCFYCPYANKTGGALQRDHSNKMMSWETAKVAIDFYFEHSIDCEEISISFYGGEPLIAYNLVKKCVEYAEELFAGKKIVFNMTTNATLFTDEMIDFFYNHNFSLLFSIDGPEKIHDINRRRSDGTGSFKIAFANLRKVAEKYGDAVKDKIGINTVINPANDADLLISLFDDKLFKEYPINVSMTLAEDIMLEDKIEVTDLYTEKMNYQYFLGLLKALKIVDGVKLIPSVKSYVETLTKTYASFKKNSAGLADIGAPGGPCIPGQRRLFVNADGDMYPCERVSEVVDVMKIGTLEKGFDFKQAAVLLNVGSLTPEKCKNCYASSKCQICGKDCISDNEFSAAEKVKHCNEVYQNFDSEILSMIVMKERRTIYKRRGC